MVEDGRWRATDRSCRCVNRVLHAGHTASYKLSFFLFTLEALCHFSVLIIPFFFSLSPFICFDDDALK